MWGGGRRHTHVSRTSDGRHTHPGGVERNTDELRSDLAVSLGATLLPPGGGGTLSSVSSLMENSCLFGRRTAADLCRTGRELIDFNGVNICFWLHNWLQLQRRSGRSRVGLMVSLWNCSGRQSERGPEITGGLLGGSATTS